MSIILDTHTFLWFVSGDDKLSENSKNCILNNTDTTYVSIASIWEIAIKLSINKLTINGSFDSIIQDIKNNGFKLLNINFEHLSIVKRLSFHHQDPFDRLIIAQALYENFPVVSKIKYSIITLFILMKL
jgi:PIN domain nuclease of toxin-antitoxin system